MTSHRKQIGHARAQLNELQHRHKQLMQKIERSHRKLDKRVVRLNRLETEIAHVERQIVTPAQSNGSGGQAAVPVLRHAYLVFNPTSGQNSQAKGKPDRLVEALRAHGIEVEVGLKTSGKVARRLTREAVAAKHKLVIAAGGDGTIEDVASQLVGTDTILGILPVGTRNNLARELGVPLDVNQACDLLAACITRKIDVGRVRANARKDVEYFLESAGLGLSGVVVPAGQAMRKGHLLKISAALLKLFELKPGPIELELDEGRIITANSQLVTVSNAPLLGVNLLIAPEAKMDDGLLDVAVYDGMTKTELTAYFLATTNGRRAYDPRVRFFRAKRVVIRSGASLPVVSDKSPIEDRHELEIELLPQAIDAIVGAGVALTLPVEAAPSVPPLAGPQPGLPDEHQPADAPASGQSAKPVPT